MKTYTKALAAIAVAAIMCICPAIVMADGSDAYTKTEGESGLSFEIESMTQAQIDKYLSESRKTYMAADVLESFVYSDGFYITADYSITDISVTELSVSRAMASSVGDDYSEYVGEEMTFKMTFTATAISSQQLFPDDSSFLVLYKKVDSENAAIGDKFEVTVTGTTKTSYQAEAGIIATEDGNFARGDTDYKSYESNEYEIEAKYTAAGSTTPLSFSVDYTYESGFTETETHDFNGVEESKLTETTKDYVTTVSEHRVRTAYECTVGDDSESTDNVIRTPASGGESTHAIMYNADMKPSVINYVVGTDAILVNPNTLGDDSIKTEDGFKAFLEETGATTSDSYSDAKSIADDAYSTVTDAEDLAVGILAIAIGALVLLLVVLVIVIVIILIVKRKKK